MFNPWDVNVTRYNNFLQDKEPVYSYSAGDTIIVGGSEVILTEDRNFYSLDDIFDATLAASGTTDGDEADSWQ